MHCTPQYNCQVTVHVSVIVICSLVLVVIACSALMPVVLLSLTHWQSFSVSLLFGIFKARSEPQAEPRGPDPYAAHPQRSDRRLLESGSRSPVRASLYSWWHHFLQMRHRYFICTPCGSTLALRAYLLMEGGTLLRLLCASKSQQHFVDARSSGGHSGVGPSQQHARYVSSLILSCTPVSFRYVDKVCTYVVVSSMHNARRGCRGAVALGGLSISQ